MGISSMSVMLGRLIRNMFAALLRRQKVNISTRPNSEKFSSISSLIVTSNTSDRVSFNFKLDTKTIAGETIKQSGIIVTP
jgi:hypothetical protein